MNSEDTIGLSLVIEASNVEKTVTDTLNITIGDDIPSAEDASVTLDVAVEPVNLVFTLDISGSMGSSVGSTGKDRLEIAIESIENLVSEYESLGNNVLVQVNTFNASATGTGEWMTSSELSTYLNNLSHSGLTNYEDALEETENNYSLSPNGGETYVYFISDGTPTTEINDGSNEDNGYLDGMREDNWNSFVNDASNEITEVFAIGIGTSVSTTYLSKISSTVELVDDPSDLSATLQSTIVIKTGSLDFDFGADGEADGTDSKLDGDKLAFTWGDGDATNSLNEIITTGNNSTISWTLTNGVLLVGTIAGNVVVKIEATDLDTNSPGFKITEFDKTSGIENITIPYTVTDGDGDSATANLSVEIPQNNEPETTDDNISTLEDIAYPLTINDFGTYTDAEGNSLTSVKIVTLPLNGELLLDGTTVTEGTTISISDIQNGKLIFDPTSNTDEDSSFTFQVSDGEDWSDTHTTSIEVIAVADVPTASIDVTKITINLIDDNNATNTTDGFVISAYNADGTLSTISTVSGTDHDGFGVSGTTSQTLNRAADSEIAYDTVLGKSEELKVEFDNDVSSVTFSFAWKHGYDLGNGIIGESAVVEFYKDGVLLDTQTYTGGSDTIDGPYTLTANGGESFDEVRFSALADGDDYLIHGLTYEEVGTTIGGNEAQDEEYTVDISAALTDLDGSETLTVVISNVPTGAVLTSDIYTLIDNGDNTWSVEIADAKSITDTLKMTVPSGTDDIDLTITARATETNDNTNGQNYEESTDQDSVVYAYSETNTLEIGSSTTNLLFTLDVSGSMKSSSTDSIGVTSTRFEVAKASIISTINAYAANGETEVNITLFNTGSDNFGWMTTSSALVFLNSLTMNSNGYILLDGNSMDDLTGNRTDYYDALNETMTVDFTGHDADNTVAYFLSDGEPNDNKNKIDEDSDQTIQNWKTYVETNIDKLNVVAISSAADVDPLEVVQVQDGDEVLVVKDVSTLGDVLLSTVTVATSGNVLDNVDFNTDGAGGLVSIKVGSTVYTDSFTDLDTPEGGKLTFDITDGSYTYTAKSSDFITDNQEVFEVIATDSDGDTTNFGLTIKIDVEPTTTENIIDLDDTDTIDLSSFIANNAITSVDGVDMTNGNINNLNIDLDDIVDLDDSDSELKIFGDSGDKVTLEGGDSNWTNTGKTEIDGDIFNVYEGSNGASNIKVLIDDDVSIEPDL